MPEGHKTHFLARRHDQQFAGEPLKVTSPQGRFRNDARKVTGKVLDRCEAVGKHLFYHFDGDRIIHVHLGRYGKFREQANPPKQPVGLVRLRMVGASHTLDLNGPMTCRVIGDQTYRELTETLGPDPLAGGKKSVVWNAVRTSSKPIGSLILDQSIVAGVGNIFRAELFFETSVDPRIPGRKLDQSTFDLLWKSLMRMMKTGLKYGKIVTVTAKEARKPRAELEGGDRFRIYGKTNCPRCETSVQTLSLASRKLYWCPSCQT